jgi:hypothetical protein
MDLLYSIRVKGNGVDKICWWPVKGVQFSVGSYFRCFSETVEASFLGKSFGNLGCARVTFFLVWIAALGKILTIDNLHQRHIVVLDWCCVCKCDGEFVDHLLLHCLVAC